MVTIKAAIADVRITLKKKSTSTAYFPLPLVSLHARVKVLSGSNPPNLPRAPLRLLGRGRRPYKGISLWLTESRNATFSLVKRIL